MDFEQTQQIDLEFSQIIRDEPDDIIKFKKVVGILTLHKENSPSIDFPLYDGVNCIGRATDNQVFIDNKALSKRHAIIQMEGNTSSLIFDLGSVNKTRRGKVFLKPQVRYNLENNDVLWFGNVKTTFKFSNTNDDDDATSEDSESLIATSPKRVPLNKKQAEKNEKIKPNFDLSSGDEETDLNIEKKVFRPKPNFALMADELTESDSEPQEPSKRKVKFSKTSKDSDININQTPPKSPSTEAFVEDSQYADSIDLLADLKLPENTEKTPEKLPPLKDISNLKEATDGEKTTSFIEKSNIFDDTTDSGGESPCDEEDFLSLTQPSKISVRVNEEPLAIPGTSKSSVAYEIFKKPNSVAPVTPIGSKNKEQSLFKETKVSRSESLPVSVDLDAMTQKIAGDNRSVEKENEPGSNHLDSTEGKTGSKSLKEKYVDLNVMTQPIGRRDDVDDDGTSSDEEKASHLKFLEMETQKIQSYSPKKSKNKSSKMDEVDLNAMTQPMRKKNDDSDPSSDEEEAPNPNIFEMETQKYESDPETRPVNYKCSKKVQEEDTMTQPIRNKIADDSLSSDEENDANPKIFETETQKIDAEQPKTPVKDSVDLNAVTQPILNLADFEDSDSFNASPDYKRPKPVTVATLLKSGNSVEESSLELTPKTSSFLIPAIPKALTEKKSKLFNANESEIWCPESQPILNKSSSIETSACVIEETFLDETNDVSYSVKEASTAKVREEKNSTILETEEQKRLMLQNLHDIIDSVSKVPPGEQATKKKEKIVISFDSDEDELPDISSILSSSNSASEAIQDNRAKESLVKQIVPEMQKEKPDPVKVPGVDKVPYTQDAKSDFINIIKNVPKNDFTPKKTVSQTDETKRNTRQRKVPKRFIDSSEDDSDFSPISSRKKKNKKTEDLKLVKNAEDKLFAKPVSSKVGKSSKSKNKKDSNLEASSSVSNNEASTSESTKSSKTKQVKGILKNKSDKRDSTTCAESIASSSSEKHSNGASKPKKDDILPKKSKLKPKDQETTTSSSLKGKSAAVYNEDDETAVQMLSGNETDSVGNKKEKNLQIKIKATKKSVKSKTNPKEMSPSFGEFEKRFEVLKDEEKSTDVPLVKTPSKDKDQVVRTRTKNKTNANEASKSDQALEENDTSKNKKGPTKRGRPRTEKRIESESNQDSDINDKPTPKKGIGKKSKVEIDKSEKTLTVEDNNDSTICNRSGNQLAQSSASLVHDMLGESSSAKPEKTSVKTKSRRKRKTDSNSESEVSSTKDSPVIRTKKEVTGNYFASPMKRPRKETKLNDSVTSSTSSTNKREKASSTRSTSPDFSFDSKTKRKYEEDFNIMFTGFTCPIGEKIIKSLGGNITEDINSCTHLITDKFRRTTKLLCAFAKGIPVINGEWIKNAKNDKTLTNYKKFILKDKDAESKYSFKTEETLKRASETPLFTGWSIYVTPKVVPAPPQMKDIIECAGGKFLPKMPKGKSEKTIIVSCEKDIKLCNAAKKNGIPVVDFEFILTGILVYAMDFKRHVL